jgi:hypothetical protein
METDEGLRFVPSRVDGLPNVTEAVIRRDRLELLADARWAAYRFAEMSESAWRGQRWRRLLQLVGWRGGAHHVGERNFCHAPRFFRFFTKPRITVYLPDEPRKGYAETLFFRVSSTIQAGGFATYDLA